MDANPPIDCFHPAHKRPHSQISAAHPPWPFSVEEASSSRTSPTSHRSHSTTMPPMRFAGDGLDFRRPLMSQSSQAVIDLTNDPDPPSYAPTARREARQPPPPSRPPRFSDQIIDLETNHGQSEGPSTHHRVPSSPEVEFVYSRPRYTDPTNRRRHYAIGRFPDLPDHRSQVPGEYTASGRLQDEVAQGVAHFAALARRGIGAERRAEADSQRYPSGLRNDLARQLQQMPINLDFEAVGFHLQHQQNRPPPPPTYKAPSPPRPGFTRSPGEEDTIVCPNCDRELGTGDDEDSRQVWVSKACGHVYCGLCTKNRKTKRSKKVELSSSKPFSKCVVEGCATSLSAPKAMLQVFL